MSLFDKIDDGNNLPELFKSEVEIDSKDSPNGKLDVPLPGSSGQSGLKVVNTSEPDSRLDIAVK